MKIVLRPHLKVRLEQRGIPQSYPKVVVNNPDAGYFDTLTNHLIAVKKMEYNGKLRPMAVSLWYNWEYNTNYNHSSCYRTGNSE